MLGEKDYEEIANVLKIVLKNEIKPQFNLLAEGQQIIIERLKRMEERLDDADIIDSRIVALEAMVKKLNREVTALKKAQ